MDGKSAPALPLALAFNLILSLMCAPDPAPDHDYAHAPQDGRHGAGDWDQTARKELDSFLSYDEIKLSALLCQVSSPTLFIG